MIPTVVEKPSSRARRAIVSASTGFRMPPPTTELTVTSNVPIFGKPLELLVQKLQALLRDIVRQDVVDADLQVIESGAIEALDAIAAEQISIRDQSGDDTVRANPPDDVVQVRVKQWLSPAEGDDAGSQRRESVDAVKHVARRNRWGVVVVYSLQYVHDKLQRRIGMR